MTTGRVVGNCPASSEGKPPRERGFSVVGAGGLGLALDSLRVQTGFDLSIGGSCEERIKRRSRPLEGVGQQVAVGLVNLLDARPHEARELEQRHSRADSGDREVGGGVPAKKLAVPDPATPLGICTPSEKRPTVWLGEKSDCALRSKRGRRTGRESARELRPISCRGTSGLSLHAGRSREDCLNWR